MTYLSRAAIAVRSATLAVLLLAVPAGATAADPAQEKQREVVLIATFQTVQDFDLCSVRLRAVWDEKETVNALELLTLVTDSGQTIVANRHIADLGKGAKGGFSEVSFLFPQGADDARSWRVTGLIEVQGEGAPLRLEITTNEGGSGCPPEGSIADRPSV